MKISTVDYPAWDKKTDALPFYEMLLETGYTGLEFVDPKHIDIAAKAGLNVLSLMAPGAEIGLNRTENHEVLIPKIADLIYLAGEKKIPYVVVFSGSRAGMSDALGHENIKEGLQVLLPEALDNNVTLLFEMMCTFDHPDYMADRAAFGLDLITDIASPNLRVLYDVYHMHRMREDYVEDLTENIACVGHIHCAESPDRSAPLADGEIPYAEIIPKAIDAGYKGGWGVFLIPGRDRDEELQGAAEFLLGFQ